MKNVLRWSGGFSKGSVQGADECGGSELRWPQSAINSISVCKIKMVVLSAAGIEGRAARWANGPALHVLLDGHLLLASSAQNGWLIPLLCGPDFDGVVRQCRVAILACVVDATALHLDRNDVAIGSVVGAARVLIEIDSAYFKVGRLHHCKTT